MKKIVNQLENLGLVKGEKIGNEIIESVFSPKNYNIIVLKTASKVHFRNYENQPLETSELWADFYIEPLTNSFFRKDKNENEEYSFWYRDLSVLKKSSQLKAYTNKVSSLGQPAILKVELKKSNKAQNMYYRDEISYLKSLDKDLANDLESQLENTIGIGEVTDLTDIAIEMIKNAE